MKLTLMRRKNKIGVHLLMTFAL